MTFFKEKLMRNGYEGALCRLASDAIIGKSLNLAIQAISGLFLLSFPVVLDVLDSCLFACFFGRMNSSRPFWPRSQGNMKKISHSQQRALMSTRPLTKTWKSSERPVSPTGLNTTWNWPTTSKSLRKTSWTK